MKDVHGQVNHWHERYRRHGEGYYVSRLEFGRRGCSGFDVTLLTSFKFGIATMNPLFREIVLLSLSAVATVVIRKVQPEGKILFF